MLTVFIMPSGKPPREERLLNSMPLGIPIKPYRVKTVAEINSMSKDCLWYSVFKDNEYLDANLSSALAVMLPLIPADMLSLFKRNMEKSRRTGDKWAFFQPRIFKWFLTINENMSPLQPFMFHEKVLDGWILDNV